MKHTLQFAALCLCVLFCCQNNKKTAPNLNEADCVSYILERDSELGKTRNHECETLTLHKTIDNYTEAMEHLNFEGCPEKFKSAFKDHISAWDAMGEFTKRHSGLRGEMHVLFDSIEKTQDSSKFKLLLKTIWDTWADVEAAQSNRTNTSKVAFEIPEADLIPEGIAYDAKTETFFVSSTYKRKIVAVDSNGKSTDFATNETSKLFGVVGMRADTERRILWALSSHAGDGMPMENMEPEEQGMSRVHKFNIDTGEELKTFELDNSHGRHFLNDLTIAKNGDVYITDTVTKRIYKIDHKTEELNLFFQLDDSMSPNGIDITDDQNYVFIAVYGGSNVVRLNLKTKALQVIGMPKGEKMIADGLYIYGNHLITVQPRNEGKIVSKFYLDDKLENITTYNVLNTHNPNLSQPTTGVIVEDDFYFIANSQLQLFKRIYNKEDDSSELKNPVILKVPIN